ncbi:MAG: bifunctional DNA-formamidopyrimidine glycosylase/DNA-(apurinic or apyrimidinic site) lyase [Rhizobiales bacterium]|nr:bifunctional DNA-formamidopyrimidine glycosylase/DNA-(apurinic or apyrimidinic site) lyase [Hyphomicrobiales bacterium]
MPELPEVETVCRALAPRLVGRRFVRVEQRRPDLRFPFPPAFAERLSGARIDRLWRRAKYMLAALDTGEVLLVHLGMSGRMLVEPPGSPERLATVALYHGPLDDGLGGTSGNAGHEARHDHVVFHMDDGWRITFNDHRRFGMMDLFSKHDMDRQRFLAPLGPEPLGNAFSPETLGAALAGRATPIKAALLDQRIVAGLGNIYVSEALFRAAISPRRLSRTIPGRRAERLVPAIREVLEAAIAAGGSTLRDYVHADGSLGYFQHTFAVYDREGAPCPRPGCGGTVRRLVQAGRSTYYCGRCQR